VWPLLQVGEEEEEEELTSATARQPGTVDVFGVCICVRMSEIRNYY